MWTNEIWIRECSLRSKICILIVVWRANQYHINFFDHKEASEYLQRSKGCVILSEKKSQNKIKYGL